MKNFSKFGMAVPELLLPKNKDLSTWSVIACDQYTQDKDYWKNVEQNAAGKESTLNLILPEVYLNDSSRSSRIQNIKDTMKQYLLNGVFDEEKKGFIYVERKTAYGRIRKGLVAAIDLDCYEWKPMSKALVRATEATIVDRIPPRKEIRSGAAVESPHIMLLVNDPHHCLVEKTGELVKQKVPVYDGNLMMDSGHITGWFVSSDEELEAVNTSLENLYSTNTMEDSSVFMFAVGDGNHSLATAKAVWDEYRQQKLDEGCSLEEINKSSVRYALVEIVNIYDEGLTFEPIHRVLFCNKNDCDAEKVISETAAALDGKISECSSESELENAVKNSTASFGFVYTEDELTKFILMETCIKELAVSRLQPVLDKIAGDNNLEMDYIHGSEEVFRLGREKNALSIMLPPVAKDSFFSTISGRGPLPRKSFSMGEASEKRFYLECRKLFD